VTSTPGLERRLGVLDGALLTIGSVIGTGIFFTAGEVARAIPDPAGFLLVWAASGLLTLAGALTYAELGAMMPRAGGLYAYLSEAYGTVWGFFYGWACLLVIMSGGIAAIAVGFGESMNGIAPALMARIPSATFGLGPMRFTLGSTQAAAIAAIVILTVINHRGLGPGALAQNALTWVRIGAIALFAALGAFAAPGPAHAASAADSIGLAGIGVGLLATLWAYDGWYALGCSAGEVRDPGRTLPRGLIGGTVVIVILYVAMNAVILRALPIATLASSARPAEAAAGVLFGEPGARMMAVVVACASFGCLASTILYSSRVYLPMAEDGVFFRSVAAIHPRFHVPVRSLWLQSAWAIALVTTGTYVQLFTWVTFAVVLFHVATAAAVYVLRIRRPDAERPYRVSGYPWVPAVFIAGMAAVLISTIIVRPAESLAGLGAIALGWPAYAWWRLRASTSL
jgi:APA family basic amino acid/polyamine antiporter